MEELKYIDIGPKDTWPKSRYGSETKEDECGEHGDWYEYHNIDRSNRALEGLKKMRTQCLRKGTDIKRLVLEYSGSGDDGDEFFCWVDNENEHKWEGYPGRGNCEKELKDVISGLDEDLIWDGLFQLIPGGWEINEGSQGYVVWDIKENEVKVHHERNVRAHEDSVTHKKLNFEGI